MHSFICFFAHSLWQCSQSSDMSRPLPVKSAAFLLKILVKLVTQRHQPHHFRSKILISSNIGSQYQPYINYPQDISAWCVISQSLLMYRHLLNDLCESSEVNVPAVKPFPPLSSHRTAEILATPGNSSSSYRFVQRGPSLSPLHSTMRIYFIPPFCEAALSIEHISCNLFSTF